MQGFLNIEKACVLFFNKTKPIIKPTSMWATWENFRYLKLLCTKGSLMTQVTNLDIENNLQYKFTSNKCYLSTNVQEKTLINIELLNI